MTRLCQAGGITGYITNHSLRVTTATCLFQSGLDEQLIMDRIGHRSIDGVRKYKRISNQQKASTSAILNSATYGDLISAPQTKKRKTTNDDQAGSEKVNNQALTQIAFDNRAASLHTEATTSSFTNVPNVIFNSCPSVTVNYYIKYK